MVEDNSQSSRVTSTDRCFNDQQHRFVQDYSNWAEENHCRSVEILYTWVEPYPCTHSKVNANVSKTVPSALQWKTS